MPNVTNCLVSLVDESYGAWRKEAFGVLSAS